jgi:hypothetical protein
MKKEEEEIISMLILQKAPNISPWPSSLACRNSSSRLVAKELQHDLASATTRVLRKEVRDGLKALLPASCAINLLVKRKAVSRLIGQAVFWVIASSTVGNDLVPRENSSDVLGTECKNWSESLAGICLCAIKDPIGTDLALYIG